VLAASPLRKTISEVLASSCARGIATRNPSVLSTYSGW
jgi:hypothetical protein